MKHLDLDIVKNSILTLAPKDSFYKKCKAVSHGNNEMLRELLFEKFIARDSGDEPEEDLKFIGNREVDIEKDGDYICDYTFCDTARDFERVATRGFEKQHRCYNRKHNYKITIWKKFCRLAKKKGIKMPRLDDLVNYIRRPDCYQDKLKFYRELIEAYHEEITEELNAFSNNDDDWEMPW